MSEELNNPVIKEDTDAETEALRQMVEAAEGAPSSSVPQPQPQETPVPLPTDEKPPLPGLTIKFPKPGEVASTPKPTDKPRDDQTGQFIKADGTQSEPGEKPPADEPKPESAYEKARKEEARKDKTWVQLQERRVALERHEAVLAERERMLNEQQQRRTAEPAPVRYSSDQLRKVALDFTNESKAHKAAGNLEEAAESAGLAADAHLAANAAEREEVEQRSKGQTAEFQKVFAAKTQEFSKEVPDVNDPASEISKRLVELFNEEPILNFHPDGVRKGYELLKMQDKVASYDKMEARVKELEAEVARYQGLTSLHGDPPHQQTRKVAFENKSIDEMTAELEEMVHAADS